MWLRISKELHTLANVTIRVQSPFWVKVIAKINAGEFGMDFAPADPQFAPPLTALHGELAASMLFMKVSTKVEMKRCDFRRVKPYNHHFQVKVGPLQFISF
jgi:hypothetical protein